MQLNVEQRKLIQSKPNGHILLKGVAGSGKTTVSVHRIPFLLNHYCFAEDDRILMVTYNKTLVNYIQYLYEKVEEENSIDYSSIFGGDQDKVDIYTIDSILYRYFISYKKKNKFELEVIENSKEKYKILAECIAELSKKTNNVKIIDQRYLSFLIDEIDWIKSCNYVNIEEYQNTDRLGRMSSQGGDGPQKLMKNSPTRKAIFELMELYNERLKVNGYIDFKDMALIALRQAKEKVEKKYTHIIIDESQDLTKVQLEFLKILYNHKDYSSIMFVADTAQSIYPHSWLVKGRSFTSIGLDMTGKSNSLSKNYRTTTQIAETAYSLIEKDLDIVEDENFVKPSLIDRQGEYPVYKLFWTPQDEASYIAKEIKNNLLTKYSHKSIAVIAKNKNQINYLREYLNKEGITNTIVNKYESNFEDDSVKLLTMHSIKGLEFKVVFIIGLNEGIIPYFSYHDPEDKGVQELSDRKLLYVGMTRANDLLYISSSGKQSKFIGEIDSKFLKLNPNSRIKRYYDVKIDEFEFKNQIIDIYSNEERVRQWLINELKNTYKYPQSLISIEYKLNSFSKVGSVDLCISIYNKNNCIPYIFFEAKALAKGLNSGLNQLKSYMSNSETVQYGVVTDGNEIIIINRKFELVEDIPLFHSSMLPTSIENYSYIDLKHNKSIEIIRDGSNPSEIIVKDGTVNIEYNIESLKRIPIFTSIAAGKPIYMNEQIAKNFYLPEEWLKLKEQCFMLQIRGDSMVGAHIEDGDYVLIQKKDTAQNRDIVAVAIGEDATLKRYMRMGDTILLIPENEKYEPIQMRDDQARILGTVVAIIKKEV